MSYFTGHLLTDEKGVIESPKSLYQPSMAIRELTTLVKDHYEEGDNSLSSPMKEYNMRSFTDQENEARRRWLSHPDAPYEGDDEWRFNGVRPITRNRVIYVAARVTEQLLYPTTEAQDSSNKVHRAAAEAMDALLDYNIENSAYEESYLFGVINGLVSPINYMSIEYCEAYQEAWQHGEYMKVVDDVFSGFQFNLTPMDEMLFSNPYCYEWQAQEWRIKRKRISYDEAQAKFGKHMNFPHVQTGRVSMVNEDGFFYDVEDINDGLVGWVNYQHRRSDLEVDFINGIYLGNDNFEFNPMSHRRFKTVKNKTYEVPLYPEVKFGFEPIDAMRFIGYKSLVDKMENDQDAADREWQDYFDASRLNTFLPVITMGAGRLDKGVVTPGRVTELGKNAKVQPLTVSNPGAAFAAGQAAEQSLNETSADPQTAGVKSGGEKTKAEVLTLESNTDTNLSIMHKFIKKMVTDSTRLMVDDVVRYQTVGEAGEIAGELLYKTFTVSGRNKEGKEKSVSVQFTDEYAGRSMSAEENDAEEYKLMEEAGDDAVLIKANPAMFTRLNWRIRYGTDNTPGANSRFTKQFRLSVYREAMQNTLVQQDPEAQLKITRDFLFEPVMRGQASKYLPDLQRIMARHASQSSQNGANPQQITEGKPDYAGIPE